MLTSNDSSVIWNDMQGWGPRDIAYAGIIAALYAALAIILAPISFGVYQVRVAESLTVLPFLIRSAPFGLFVGCLLANIYGGYGVQDIVFGSLLTLAAGYLTLLCGRIKAVKLGLSLAPLPPVLLNAFGVAAYLSQMTGMTYFFVVQMIGLGELVSCYVLGLPLLLYLRSRMGRIRLTG
ncbi:putative membrane protein [Candidatus Zixiibacteriota bacterium]|nr:putative membrane protein [candidate division Zixibacteria bacterium]